MKFIFGIVNTVQIILIILWTALCGILGMVLMLITWNGKWVHHVNGRYMWSPFVCLITGVRVKVQGLEKINKNKSFIYISNHESHFDILALSRVMPVGLFFIATDMPVIMALAGAGVAGHLGTRSLMMLRSKYNLKDGNE